LYRAVSGVYNSIQLLAKMDATIKQDLPPSGGYEKIQYARNPAKVYFRGMFRLNILGIVLM
jgi:GRIM-19 protein